MGLRERSGLWDQLGGGDGRSCGEDWVCGDHDHSRRMGRRCDLAPLLHISSVQPMPTTMTLDKLKLFRAKRWSLLR